MAKSLRKPSGKGVGGQSGHEGGGLKLMGEPDKYVTHYPFTVNGIEIPEEDYVEMHDDLFTRFHDYFIWIETYNPVGPKEFNRGFNYYGQTAIRDDNLVKFSKLIDSLICVFENAPEDIVLTGNFCWGSPDAEVSLDDNPHRGYYQKIEIEKDDLIRIFGDLRMMADRAIKNNGYLLHFGI